MIWLVALGMVLVFLFASACLGLRAAERIHKETLESEQREPSAEMSLVPLIGIAALAVLFIAATVNPIVAREAQQKPASPPPKPPVSTAAEPAVEPEPTLRVTDENYFTQTGRRIDATLATVRR